MARAPRTPAAAPSPETPQVDPEAPAPDTPAVATGPADPEAPTGAGAAQTMLADPEGDVLLLVDVVSTIDHDGATLKPGARLALPPEAASALVVAGAAQFAVDTAAGD